MRSSTHLFAVPAGGVSADDEGSSWPLDLFPAPTFFTGMAEPWLDFGVNVARQWAIQACGLLGAVSGSPLTLSGAAEDGPAEVSAQIFEFTEAQQYALRLAT